MSDNVTKGVFFSTLSRNNRKIRQDRAVAIAEDAEIQYKRRIEDMERKIKQLRRDRENMLDLSPTNAQSLILASDFKSDAFIDKDIEIGVKIRNLQIQIDIAKSRYEYLFGEEKESCCGGGCCTVENNNEEIDKELEGEDLE